MDDLYCKKNMMILSTDNDGIMDTARNMASAQKKAVAYVNKYNVPVYIMIDEGETGFRELKAINPTKE